MTVLLCSRSQCRSPTACKTLKTCRASMIDEGGEASKPRARSLETVMLSTLDPSTKYRGGPVPAVTTLLYKVCGGDPAKYEEACRLVGLFMEAARDSK